ncbi:hypothetical protein K0M31_000581 [Melipona bicolor]|uniref:Uncharacterized protein n=1 Tax=Melipona bicolor TaxID=60889 RepID=A0AA40GE46_9HYME|nr:hypothetical protein K0M31_000581 [Melipona bicolor]
MALVDNATAMVIAGRALIYVALGPRTEDTGTSSDAYVLGTAKTQFYVEKSATLSTSETERKRVGNSLNFLNSQYPETQAFTPLNSLYAGLATNYVIPNSSSSTSFKPNNFNRDFHL